MIIMTLKKSRRQIHAQTKHSVIIILLSCFFLLPRAWAAETTGTLAGIVHTSSEKELGPFIKNPLLQSTYLSIIAGENTQPLTGATIVVESPSLMGKRGSITDERGYFRLVFLPPGHYTVTVQLAGFATVNRSDVTVSLGRTTSLHFTLKPCPVSESIEVTAASPLIDMKTATTGGTITQRDFSRLPIKRTYQDIAALFAGVDNSLGDFDLTMSGSPSMLDSSGAENNYIIDGFTTTDPYNGTSGTDLTFNFIEDVEIKTGGYEAEYGRATGGIINVITRSGGNVYSGNLITYFNTYDMIGSGKYGTYRGKTSDRVLNQHYDIGVDLGGYLVKDKLWFFLAYNPSFDENKWHFNQGETRRGELITNHFAAKLTWSIGPRYRLVFSAFGDPSRYEGCDLSNPVPNRWFIGADPKFVAGADESAYQKIIQRGSQNYILNYTGIVTDSLVVEVSLGYRNQRDSSEPALDEGNDIQRNFRWDDPTDYGFADHLEYTNGYVAGGVGIIHDLTSIRKMFDVRSTWYRTGHTLKAGLNYEQNGMDFNLEFSGGKLFSYAPEHYELQTMSVRETTETINTALFVQDNWQVNDYLIIDLGLRYEIQELKACDGSTAFTISDNIAPRIGLSWDVMNNNKSKVFASYGRFYEAIPLQMNLFMFSNSYWDAEVIWYGPDGLPETSDDYLGYSLNIMPEAQVDPDLKGQCLDEYLLGSEYEVAPYLALGIVFRYRNIIRIIEDGLWELNPNNGSSLTYEVMICNPGEGQASELDKPKREYTAVELTADKRFSNRYQFNLSYVWSRLWGNYEGLYDPYFTDVYCHFSPLGNIGSDDSEDIKKNIPEGYLYQDIRHRFKLHGAYAMDSGLTIGSLLTVQSGRPISALLQENYVYGYSFEGARGSEGRTPWLWQWDLHAEYSPRLWHKVDTTVILDVFNVTNNNEIKTVQNFKSTFAGYSEYPSPYWKEPLTYQLPRRISLGFRFRF
ncbi:TonB-dependent receptor domain-containing protein [candidate division CSSED10-310 bacterium]|uniref:TonB-dependent receptor domain-containing protein n=1 Tax=candidate division CSSED10-310 bacterium TaxID=2855610 RepID=A0ABV6Z3P3_UNCC1